MFKYYESILDKVRYEFIIVEVYRFNCMLIVE